MEEMKRARGENDDAPALKRLREAETAELEVDDVRLSSVEDEDEDSSSSEISTESASELLTTLLDDSASFGMKKVRFSENPYSSAVIFQPSCSYITINGNEESCGSSFSEWESSVMASVDTGGILRANVNAKAEEGGAWGRSEEEARWGMIEWEWERERGREDDDQEQLAWRRVTV